MSRPVRNPFADFTDLNGLGDALPPRPLTGRSAYPIDVHRMQLAGGILQTFIMHRSVTPFEAVYRRLPSEGVFAATPSTPFEFEIGSFKVPGSMVFVLLDYRFDIYRFNGVALGDFIPIEPRRLSTQIGWDITSSSKRQGNLRYELFPSEPSTQRGAYRSNSNAGIIPGESPPVASQDAFDQARFAQNQAATSAALSMMPQRHHREGLMQVPYSWVMESTERLQITCTAFNAVPIPLAFFEANITGALIPQNTFAEFMKNAAPPELPPGGI